MSRQGRIDVVINARSGTAGKEAAAERTSEYLSARGIGVRVELVRTSADLRAAIAHAAGGDADTVVAGGGDGTIAAVASALVDLPKALAVLPLGTFNYFARRIGVPIDLDAALEVVATGRARTFAVGEVNGRIFINNSSIGLYPAAVKRRETAYLRFGRSRVAAYLSAGLLLMRPPGVLNLELSIDGSPLDRRTPLLFVGVNPHQLEAFGIPGYECVEDGRLAVYVTRPLALDHLWRLGVRGLLRDLTGAEEFEVICGRELLVGVGRKRVRVALDGEVIRLHGPLRYKVRPEALRVLVPNPVDSATAD